MSEDAAPVTRSLAGVFSDFDDSVIAKSVISNSNAALAAATIDGDTLTLTFAADGNGEAILVIRGTANGKTADDEVLITVTPVDDAPFVANEIADITADEDAADTVIDLTGVFSDIDSDVSAIVASVSSNDNPSLVAAEITDLTLTLDYQDDQNGEAVIVIEGTIDGKSVTDEFTVTVNPVDDAPVVGNGIGDVTADEDAAPVTVDLADVFTDIDSDPSEIVKTVLSNSSPDLLSATVSGNILTLAFQPDQNGTATLRIQGESVGKTAEDEFTVTVNPVDDPPVLADLCLPDIHAVRDDPDTTTDLNDVFTDIDNAPSEMTFSASSGDASLVAASVSGNSLILAYQEGQIGETNVTVTAMSGGETVSCEFSVTVVLPEYTLSGKVTYYNSGIPVPGTIVTLDNGADSLTAVTDESGEYRFPDITEGTSVTVTPFREEAPTPEILSATDASDIVEIVIRDIRTDGVGVGEMERKAADVTRNDEPTGMDASRVARFTTGLVTVMSTSPSTNPDEIWRFDPDPVSLTVTADIGDLNFVTAMSGDLSVSWIPEGRRRSPRDPEYVTEITVTPGRRLSVPVVLNEETLIRGIDIVAEFDGDVLYVTDVTLAGGILEDEDYEMVVNAENYDTVLIALFARSNRLTGSGSVVTLNFDVVGQMSDSLLTMTKFWCNEVPVSEDYDGTVSGGFRMSGTVSQALGITVGDDPPGYDLNGDGRIGMEDVIQALQQEDPGAAIRALQCLTGK